MIKNILNDEVEIKYDTYQALYNIAEIEKNIVVNEIEGVLDKNNEKHKVEKLESRIKTYDSLIDKMKNKGYELKVYDMLEKINDIIGVRLVCSNLNDVYELAKCIRNDRNFEIVNEKDYISKPKESGYMSYHMIVECDLYTFPMRAEIQLRTRDMDEWANFSHDLIYKKKNKDSILKYN